MATEAPPTYLNPIYSPFLYAANNIAVTMGYLTTELLLYAQLSGATFTGACNFTSITASGTLTAAAATINGILNGTGLAITASTINVAVLTYTNQCIQDGAFGVSLNGTTAIAPYLITTSNVRSHYATSNTGGQTGYMKIMDGTGGIGVSLFPNGTIIEIENQGTQQLVLSNQNNTGGSNFVYNNVFNSTITIYGNQILTVIWEPGNGWHCRVSSSTIGWWYPTNAYAAFSLTCSTGSAFNFSNATVTLPSITGAVQLLSTLGVTGATTLSSTLGVTGATTLSSTLGVTGTTTVGTIYTVLAYMKNTSSGVYPSFGAANFYGAIASNFLGDGCVNFWNLGYYMAAPTNNAFNWVIQTSGSTYTELMFLTNAGNLSVPQTINAGAISVATLICSNSLAVTDLTNYFGKLWAQTGGLTYLDYYNTLAFRSATVTGSSPTSVMTLTATSITASQPLTCTTINCSYLSASAHIVEDGPTTIASAGYTISYPGFKSHYIVTGLTTTVTINDSSSTFPAGSLIVFENNASNSIPITNQLNTNGNDFWFNYVWNTTINLDPGQQVTMMAVTGTGWHCFFLDSCLNRVQKSLVYQSYPSNPSLSPTQFTLQPFYLLDATNGSISLTFPSPPYYAAFNGFVVVIRCCSRGNSIGANTLTLNIAGGLYTVSGVLVTTLALTNNSTTTLVYQFANATWFAC